MQEVQIKLEAVTALNLKLTDAQKKCQGLEAQLQPLKEAEAVSLQTVFCSLQEFGFIVVLHLVSIPSVCCLHHFLINFSVTVSPACHSLITGMCSDMDFSFSMTGHNSICSVLLRSSDSTYMIASRNLWLPLRSTMLSPT